MTDDAQIRDAILDAIHARGAGKTICPSEVARALAKEWHPLIGDVRRAAQTLADQGALVVTQRGVPVDARMVKGPIRLGLPGGEGAP